MNTFYISTPAGVRQFSLARSEEKLIIRAGNFTNNGLIREANIKTPGSLSSLNKDVLLIVDEGTPSLRVANLQTGLVSSICKPHDSKALAVGNISDCKLHRPKYLAHEPGPQNGSIYIGGTGIRFLTYVTIKNLNETSKFQNTIQKL